MADTAAPAAPALDRALTFALIEVAMTILMGDRRATLTLPERAAFGRQARALLEQGVITARELVALGVEYGCTERDAVERSQGIAGAHLARVEALGDARAVVIYRGQLAELDYLARL